MLWLFRTPLGAWAGLEIVARYTASGDLSVVITLSKRLYLRY